jgi:hypothetical protein
MAKKTPKIEAPVEVAAPETAAPKSRGPKGVANTAVISLLAGSNPKRAGSKAQGVFACYVDGMTVAEFCDAVDAAGFPGEGTPNLVYDAKHGFISIDGYDPGQIVVPKVREPKAPKEPRAKKVKADPVADAAVEAEAEAETME